MRRLCLLVLRRPLATVKEVVFAEHGGLVHLVSAPPCPLRRWTVHLLPQGGAFSNFGRGFLQEPRSIMDDSPVPLAETVGGGTRFLVDGALLGTSITGVGAIGRGVIQWGLRRLTARSATLRPYGGPGGGHHVPAQSAFRGAPGYDARAALAIPNAELARLGVSHSAVTGAQMTGYRALARSGAPLTWEAVATVEVNALFRGGMAPGMARSTVDAAIRNLQNAGVAGPTRIPWGF